ncbi:hypothetical protein [Streptomyces europaeiscabiei]|uniref:hypothetical protein n=1 Tax=Streptomyces europaeiscabiei TaxID=146819 RepID=UPI00069A0125|nr:hypothetical protein [Streptomyces europaeiscabiei]
MAFRILSAVPDLNGMPGDLLPMVEQALAKEPGDRPTAAELASTCTALLATQATVATPHGEEQPTLVSDLVSMHWDVPHEDDLAWHAAPHQGRRKMYLAVVAAALAVGSIGGAIAATSVPTRSVAEQEQPAASSSKPKPVNTVNTPTTAEPTSSRGSDNASRTPAPAASEVEPARQSNPAPAYTRSDSAQPSTDEWANARVPATLAEKAAAQRLGSEAEQVLQDTEYLDGTVTVTFNPQAQTMFVTFGPGIYPEGQDYQDDPDWTEVRRALMFGSCSEAQLNFHDDITWPYGRAAVVYRESMASPVVADFREATHTDSCRV